MKIANIVSKNNITINDDFNVVKSMDEIIHGLPTLIIGFDYVNKHYPDFDILNIELGPNLYWTYKRNERRDEYQIGLSWFINKVYGDLLKPISYVFVDPIQLSRKSVLKCIKKIYSLKNKITYIYRDMVYIYGENLIFGIDLNLLKYIGCNQNTIKEKIINKSNVVIDDKTAKEFSYVIEELKNQVKYIPFLFSLKNQ